MESSYSHHSQVVRRKPAPDSYRNLPPPESSVLQNDDLNAFVPAMAHNSQTPYWDPTNPSPTYGNIAQGYDQPQPPMSAPRYSLPHTNNAQNTYTMSLDASGENLGAWPDRGRQDRGYENFPRPPILSTTPMSNSTSTSMEPPPPVPSKIALSTSDNSGATHLTKPRPKQYVETRQPPQGFNPSPRSASQPSPTTRRLHKSTPSQSSLLSPAGQYSPIPSPKGSPVIHGRDRSNSLAPPSTTMGPNHSRTSSGSAHTGGSVTPYHSDGSPDGRGEKRRSRVFGGGRSRASSKAEKSPDGLTAWVISLHNKISYDTQLIIHGEKIPELWDDVNGDVYVYLFPLSSGRSPSFKVPSSTIAASPQLMALAFGQGVTYQRARSFDGRSFLAAEDASRNLNARRPSTPPDTPRIPRNENSSDRSGQSVSPIRKSQNWEYGHLYFPFIHITNGSVDTEAERFVLVRNLFAFLTGQPLVGTRKAASIFKILCAITDEVRRLGFTNLDGSSFGEHIDACVDFCVDDLNLADVRTSREKTVEGLVLGERLRSTRLYDEAFSHTVGKYDAIQKIGSPVWGMVSEITRVRVERAHMELERRQFLIQLRLSDCEFPSLFSGTAASSSSNESKAINFRAWRSSFCSTRKFVLGYYKSLHGNWPPRASSKKNSFSESGFNRLVLKGLYIDFCAVYDLLVDRENLTNRSETKDRIPESVEKDSIYITALRKLLTEYDGSDKPNYPAIPFDVPKVPTITTIDANHLQHIATTQDQANNRKLQENKVQLLLLKARNMDSDRNTPFLNAFREFEAQQSRGRSAQELADLRYGQWLFIYVVLNALPMLVIDAPGCHHTTAVEYFLCIPPQGGPPWNALGAVEMGLFRNPVTGQLVRMPTDSVKFSYDGIYERSHCWEMSVVWEKHVGNNPSDLVDYGFEFGHPATLVEHDPLISPLEHPAPPFAAQSPRSESMSGDSAIGYGTAPDPLAENFGVLRIDGRKTTLSPELDQEAKDRARSRSAHRRSMAFGLEQLPMPANFGTGQGSRDSPPIAGSSRRQGNYMSAGIVIDNKEASPGIATGPGIRHASEGSASGKTFDDILNSIEAEGDKDRKRGRRSFFGGGSK